MIYNLNLESNNIFVFYPIVPPPNRAYLRSLIHNGDLEHLVNNYLFSRVSGIRSIRIPDSFFRIRIE